MSLFKKWIGLGSKRNLPVEQYKQTIEIIRNSYIDSYMALNLVDAKAIKELYTSKGTLFVKVELPYPAKSGQSTLVDTLKTSLAQQTDFAKVAVEVTINIPIHQGQRQEAARIKNVIAISSGKGGVGKSTTTVNIALSLAAQGASVGILDADLYGPSQQLLLGLPEGTRPETRDMRYYAPVQAHGVKLMSMGLMVSEKTPMMWRGAVASETIQQLISQTLWGDLDYLLIDMPPGTGDIHISLSQSLVIAGAVVVTTPQNAATLDAQKGIEMFNRVDVPILGVIENMATHQCSQCGHIEHIFGCDGGHQLASQFEAPLLGSLPLMLAIREQSDRGEPIVLSAPDSDIAKTYQDLALKIAVNVAKPGLIRPLPQITFVDEQVERKKEEKQFDQHTASHSEVPTQIRYLRRSRSLELVYSDSSAFELSSEFLRVHSPSAEVKGHGPGQEVLQVGKQDVSILGIEHQGNYAIKISFDDGHNTGIYSWPYLRDLVENKDTYWSRYIETTISDNRPRFST